MELDEDGILKVFTNEINGEHSKSIQIEIINNLSPEQIKQFKEQELIFQNDDKLYKQKIDYI